MVIVRDARALIGRAELVDALSIEDGGKRIRLSRAQALRMEEDAETRAYMQDATRKRTGFGTALGEALRRAQQK